MLHCRTSREVDLERDPPGVVVDDSNRRDVRRSSAVTDRVEEHRGARVCARRLSRNEQEYDNGRECDG